MPPVLDPSRCKVDGLAFIGLSLTRANVRVGNPDSSTHQTAFDFDTIQDRSYDYLASTNDDGWLVGGGEPPESFKLTARDSAHVELMRIGTFDPALGGLSVNEIKRAIESGAILIPEITVCPTAVVANGDSPPELEVRFDLEAAPPSKFEDEPLPMNWQLRFIHNQLFHQFHFAARFCPGAHHMTFCRKAEFKSPHYRAAYFRKCAKQIEDWKRRGPQPLVPRKLDASIERVSSLPCSPSMLRKEMDWADDNARDSGLYLFRDRNTITHYFAPNFFPPYDTPEKKSLIMNVISQEWDEHTLSWKAASDKNVEKAMETGCGGLMDLSPEYNPFAAAWKAVVEPEASLPKTQVAKVAVVTPETTHAHRDEKGISGFGGCGVHDLVEELLNPQPDPRFL
ncbi:hypothetical protein MPSEU_000619000 [Mayamaea pseudoterrestris]|nr:hypothetical protein MPSEU_000619000 [Mayamaea pseudoterrestris]